jgi:DNA-binding transcriptional MerR regulator
MLLTAKQIADRLASTPDDERRARSMRPINHPASQDDEGRTYRPENDAMWEAITAKLNAELAAEIEVKQLLFDRVRHWTREGLISPAGEKNPGTGRARLYDESAVRKALVLNSLTEVGLTVRSLHLVIDFLDSRAAEWQAKTAGSSDPVYLVIQKLRRVEKWDMRIQTGDNMPELGKAVEFSIVVGLTG